MSILHASSLFRCFVESIKTETRSNVEVLSKQKKNFFRADDAYFAWLYNNWEKIAAVIALALKNLRDYKTEKKQLIKKLEGRAKNLVWRFMKLFTDAKEKNCIVMLRFFSPKAFNLESFILLFSRSNSIYPQMPSFSMCTRFTSKQKWHNGIFTLPIWMCFAGCPPNALSAFCCCWRTEKFFWFLNSLFIMT